MNLGLIVEKTFMGKNIIHYRQATLGFEFITTFPNGAAFCARGLDMESEEHYRAVGQVCNEVTVPTRCNGRVQEGSSPLSSGSLHPVVVT